MNGIDLQHRQVCSLILGNFTVLTFSTCNQPEVWKDETMFQVTEFKYADEDISGKLVL